MKGKNVFLLSLLCCINAISAMVFQNKCIEDLGCFYTGPPFYNPIYRPISLSPTEDVNVRFELFTPTNPQEEEVIEPTQKSIEDSSFNPQFPLKVLIHGFRAQLNANDVRYQTKDEFLKIGNFNVIVVNWSKINGNPYPQAVANSRVVGAKLAKLLKIIMNTTGMSYQNMHLIGHSLGAHVAGYAGERIASIGRITGLDAAGPFFQPDDPRIRLDTTDALFVDLIHTNGPIVDNDNYGTSLGLGDPVGHLDFYPNGGMIQPGCASISDNRVSGNNIEDPTEEVSCSHLRANFLFKESIDDSRCRFLGVRCSSYIAFRSGECPPQDSTVAEMGYHAKKIEGLPKESKFYLETNDKEPFCLQNQDSTEEVTNNV